MLYNRVTLDLSASVHLGCLRPLQPHKEGAIAGHSFDSPRSGAPQAGLRSGLQYSVTVEQPQPRLGPKKGKARAAAPPQVLQLDDVDAGFDTIEVQFVSICSFPPTEAGFYNPVLRLYDGEVLRPACAQRTVHLSCCMPIE